MERGKRVAIMQPYFLPYLGYWQLMADVDEFVVYDDIQFTKKGWIHRNRYLSGGKDRMFSLPLKKDSDYLHVVQRCLSGSWSEERDKLYRKLTEAYKKAPFFQEVKPLLEDCLFCDSSNLFDFILNSIERVKEFLCIETELKISSRLGNTAGLKGQDRVLKICDLIGAVEYVNPIGGKELYSAEHFARHGIDLKFHEIDKVVYDQCNKEFIPYLSIIDCLMFNGQDQTINLLCRYKLHE